MDVLSNAYSQGNVANLNIDVVSVLDATIDKIYTNGNSRYVTICYIVIDQNYTAYNNLVTLIVGPNTQIKDPFGENFPFDNLRVGMIVDADFSSAMTKSIPPQSNAYRIIVNYRNWPFYSMIGRVLGVDVNNRLLMTGIAGDIYSQMRFSIPTSTQILDKAGNRIRLGDLSPHQIVKIDYATFMTMSIPPQTTAFRVQLL